MKKAIVFVILTRKKNMSQAESFASSKIRFLTQAQTEQNALTSAVSWCFPGVMPSSIHFVHVQSRKYTATFQTLSTSKNLENRALVLFFHQSAVTENCTTLLKPIN